MYESFFQSIMGNGGAERCFSLEQIVVLNIYRVYFKISDLKNCNKMVKELMRDKVLTPPNYKTL